MGSYTRSMVAASSHRHPSSRPSESPFLDLPPELRDLIYNHLLSPAALCRPLPDEHGEDSGYRRYLFHDFLSLQLTSKLVGREATGVFRNINHFVRISTPWPEAQQHVQAEGRVPMICLEEKARAFEGWSMGVLIDAPQLRGLGPIGGDEEEVEAGLGMTGARDECIFVIHVRDVRDFCRMWYYSDLSHPGLNMHLDLTLILRSPWQPVVADKEAMDVDEGKTLPRQVQKQFMDPFGSIKGLTSVKVDGDFDAAIYDNMMSTMQVPYETPEHCLDMASKRRDEGDIALNKNKDFRRAIDLYFDAFEHLHIRCEGRRRSIYGDAWFVKTLESGKYEGQQGHLVRLVLRVQLVSGVVHAYLGLSQWEDARYWGMRSINLMREANGDEDGEHEDEPMLNFPGAESVGLIYLGTAIAYRELKQRDDARRYAKVAAAYLPNSEEVQRVRKDLQLKRVGGYGWI